MLAAGAPTHPKVRLHRALDSEQTQMQDQIRAFLADLEVYLIECFTYTGLFITIGTAYVDTSEGWGPLGLGWPGPSINVKLTIPS